VKTSPARDNSSKECGTVVDFPALVFRQVAGQATLGTTADFKGIVLCQTATAMNTGAVMNGRALAQTAVTLDANVVAQP
jgi:hypothetical protein